VRENYKSKKFLTFAMIARLATVSSKGQLAIPIDIRKAAGIEKGSDLLILYKDGKILIEAVELLSNRVDDDFEDIKYWSMKALERAWGNEEDKVWDDAAERYSASAVQLQRPRRSKAKARTRRLKR
jgi:AbrB family looped-hinge helix DNA binding protein